MNASASSASQAAVIYGLTGHAMSAEERAFFRDVNPYGYIVFARNLADPKQVRALTDSLRDLSGRADLPILIDQEGGRVARLKPPHWRPAPPARKLVLAAGESLEDAKRLVYDNARLIARELHELGITVDCAPLVDVPVPDAHDIIGDRAFSEDPKTVSILGREMARGLLDGGVLPVVKHIPGHGRARADSHEVLPEVETSFEELDRTDFVPFKALSDLPMAMTAHVRYTAIDPEVATLSPKMIKLIREHLGFDGLLMSDDLSMKALSGDFAERTRLTLKAGCDIILHCNGDMAEMQAIASVVGPMSKQAASRAERVSAMLKDPAAFDYETAQANIAKRVAAVA